MSNGNITIIGNLADDPDLRFTPNGSAVANFRVGVTERYRDNSGEWKDRDTSWFSVQCWNALAENVAQSLARGSRVTVTGTMRQRSYVDKNDEKRFVWELHADDVGVSLRYAIAETRKSTRGTNFPDDPWSDARPNGNGEPAASEPASEPATTPAARTRGKRQTS